MAREHSRSDGPRLPIKVTLPKQGTERSVHGGGSRHQPFCQVDTAFRERLGRQVTAIRKAIAPVASRTGGVPARVKLHPLARAKSHRPGTLFSSRTCPIIGGGALGELFVKATPEGLDKISAQIYGGDSQRIVKELSAVSVIEPVTPEIRRGRRTARDILRDCPRRSNGFLVRVRLFDFDDGGVQGELYKDFIGICQRREISVASDGYSERSLTYEVNCRSVDDIEAIAACAGVRSISAMPIVRVAHQTLACAGLAPTNPSSALGPGSGLSGGGAVDRGFSKGPSALNGTTS